MKTFLQTALVIALLISFSSMKVNPKIAIRYSIEAAVVEADVVAVGLITELHMGRDKGGEPMASVTLKVQKGLKGCVKEEKLYLSEKGSSMRTLEELMDMRRPVLYILRRTVEAYSRGNGGSYDLWPMNGSLNTSPHRIDFTAPPALYTAYGFRQLMMRDHILGACEGALIKEQRHFDDLERKRELFEEIEMAQLEVPFGSDAHGAMYGGSACYLIVPAFLFTDAPKLGE